MSDSSSANSTLADDLINRLDALLREAEKKSKPLEMPPYREQLFELFVTADGAGYLKEDIGVDLSADGICQILADRWGLAEETRTSTANQTKLSPEQLSKMRMLWSLMRMWMEWNYAWSRWNEFHDDKMEEI